LRRSASRRRDLGTGGGSGSTCSNRSPCGNSAKRFAALNRFETSVFAPSRYEPLHISLIHINSFALSSTLEPACRSSHSFSGLTLVVYSTSSSQHYRKTTADLAFTIIHYLRLRELDILLSSTTSTTFTRWVSDPSIHFAAMLRCHSALWLERTTLILVVVAYKQTATHGQFPWQTLSSFKDWRVSHTS